ncbi:hypothetical protein [Pararhodonellum marinum]|uniref:hypothetical protein n=1 Tax=Pararhodonellum marinum TaxID=2755358 RepID=UPI00188EB0D6|nr:hypothetical protein [Pararhodonellum marinum]
MGFVPIFLTLSGFLFLFVMVVTQTFKAKLKQYQNSLDHLAQILDSKDSSSRDFSELEANFLLQKQNQTDPVAVDKVNRARPHLQSAKRLKMEYNRLIKTKPYQFIAKVIGYTPI